jgi:dTDP-4-amino-4,6-dideoxygalactose transaminase
MDVAGGGGEVEPAGRFESKHDLGRSPHHLTRRAKIDYVGGEQMSLVNACESQLAVAGGTPVRHARFAPWPAFGPAETEAAVAVLQSGKVNYWTGDEGRRFEAEFAASVDCQHAVALANGSVALELALYALHIGPGDEVIVPSRTFVASASCVVMRGARPVFADVDRDSQNLTAESIVRVLTPRSKAIIVVHLAGWPCDMDSILEVARQYGLKVIEDCAQAQGATYKGRPVGSLGDVAAFSFCQDKIMTTCGEGGMLTTNDPQLWERAWSFKDHGKNYGEMANAKPLPGFRWVHDGFGTNWRMTEVQSAVGRVLLGRLPQMIEKRRDFARLLTQGLGHIPGLRTTVPLPEIGHAYYKYYAFLRPQSLRPGWSQMKVLEAINAEGIPASMGSCSEIYLEKAFSELRPQARLTNARELGETSLMFLLHPTLCEKDMTDTCSAVEKVMQVACES